MEENQENNLNLQPTPPIENVAETTPKKGKILVFTNVLLTLLVIGLGIYIFIIERKTKELEKENKKGVIVMENEEDNEIVKKPQIKNSVGKYIKAELPTGWEIVEYGNGEGAKILVEGINYKGLTGLKISYNQKNILTMSAVDGFGSNECPKLPHFADSSEKYESYIRKMVEGTGKELELINYSSGDYSEYKWFDRNIRRVGDTFHYDTQNNNAYFEPQCLFSIIAFDTPLFSNDSNSPTLNSYQYELEKTAAKTVLEQLDAILKSMKVI